MQPQAASVPVGTAANLTVGSAIVPLSAAVRDPSIASAAIDQPSQRLSIIGKSPGATIVTVSDARGLRVDVPVRVAYYAGTIAPYVKLEVTGDPASGDFVREQVARAVQGAAGLRPGAQVLVTPDDVPFAGSLDQDLSLIHI